jgi:predicted anti-sigma-YlaC factor YlaD
MNCQRIKELLLTDYTDGEASRVLQEEVKTHLKTCSGCRVFEQDLREKVSKSFSKIESISPPEEVWQRIKETIEQEQALYTPSLLRRLLDFLRRSLLARKPAFVFSTVFAVFLVMLLFSQLSFRKQRLVRDYLRQQSDYMLSLRAPVYGELELDVNFGTSIERYLF